MKHCHINNSSCLIRPVTFIRGFPQSLQGNYGAVSQTVLQPLPSRYLQTENVATLFDRKQAGVASSNGGSRQCALASVELTETFLNLCPQT